MATWDNEADVAALLNGRLPPGWKISDRVDGSKILLGDDDRLQHIPTCVVFVIDVMEVDNDVYISTQKRRYQILTRVAKFDCLVAMTHIDKIPPRDQESPAETVDRLRDRVCAELGAPKYVPSVNRRA